MKLRIHTAHSELPEFIYISKLIFGDWLGLDFELMYADHKYTTLSIDGCNENILLPDVFFNKATFDKKNKFYSDLICADRYVLPDILGQHLDLKDVPGLFKSEELFSVAPTDTFISLDIFGASFFLVSRIEEYHTIEKDEHGRYVGNNSLMSKLDCINIPVVDIYVEILWHHLLKVAPTIKRKEMIFTKNISCDVDNPFLFHSPYINLLKRVGGDLVYRKSLKMASNTVLGILSNKYALKNDPFAEAIDFIIHENNKADNRVQFNFIPYATSDRFDGRATFLFPEVKEMMRKIVSSGHFLGIHPGYETFNNECLLTKSVEIYKQDEGKGKLIKGRQHYLRWEVGVTDLLYVAAGIRVDSSLGNADVGGFRCGTSRKFPIFSLKNREVLDLVEEPLLIMENTYFAEKYLNFGVSEDSLRKMLEIKNWCRKLNGLFSVLWHNTSLLGEKEKEMYVSLIK
tara:strand:- start:2689 stop:4059 length:1371 start_codon:yes stop_codon:yes gene_type:complete